MTPTPLTIEEKKLPFPKEPNATLGWRLDFNFLQRVQEATYSVADNDEGYHVELEGIEDVLLSEPVQQCILPLMKEIEELKKALEWATSILTVDGAYEMNDYLHAKGLRKEFGLDDSEVKS